METQDLRKKKTYSALVRAFEELMRKKDIDALTVRELCQRAEIGRNTFYANFEDKYAFFRYYISMKKEMIERRSSVSGDDFFMFRMRTLRELFEYLRENRFIWEKNITSRSAWMLREMLKDSMKEPFIAELNKLELQSGNTFRISKEVLASFYASGILDVFTAALYNDTIPEDSVLKDLEQICSKLLTSDLLQ